MKKTINGWAILANQDRNEGRGPMKVIAHATTKGVALQVVGDPRYAERYGVQGTPGGPGDVREDRIVIVETAEDFFIDQAEAEKKEALAKLTTREKELLGLK